MNEEQLEKLEVGEKLTSPAFEGEAEIKSIDRHYNSAVIEAESGGALATIPVGFDGLLSHWEIAK